MKEVYILCKPEEVEKVQKDLDSISQETKDKAEFHIITDINEIPEEKRAQLEVINLDEKYKEPQPIDTYTFHKLPEVRIEEYIERDCTEFQKLSSFDRKVKNQARQRLEKQALKYQNRHYKK